jgi:predicted nucleic acid-binding Zn ribbon protein
MPKPWKPTEPARLYLHLKKVFGDPSKRGTDARRRRDRERDADTIPYGRGREPRGLGDVVGSLTSELGWTEPLARSEVLAAWPEVVGDEMAKHSVPMTIDKGTLVIRCDSTAWATQLRLMRATITTFIAERYPEAGVESISVNGPDAPTWKRGLRSVQGRGPRDTYG